MRCYKLAAANQSATANGAASLQILRSGRIRRVQWSVIADSITDNSAFRVEVSFANVSQIAVNNTPGPFSEVGQAVNLLTSGLTAFGINQDFEVDCPVGGGELIYLNVTAAGTISAQVACFVWVEESKER